MNIFITSVLATISLVFLVIYDFICLCYITGKQKVVETIWKYIFPKKQINETFLFNSLRFLCMQVWFLCYLLSDGVLNRIPVYNTFVFLGLFLSCASLIKTITRK